MLPADHEVS
jgi:hypothetical protein